MSLWSLESFTCEIKLSLRVIPVKYKPKDQKKKNNGENVDKSDLEKFALKLPSYYAIYIGYYACRHIARLESFGPRFRFISTLSTSRFPI